MIYLDSAGRSFQNYADNIVKQFQQTFSYAYDPSAINRFNNCDSFIILNDTEKEIFEAVLLAIKEDSTIINPPSDSETISSLFMKMQLKNDTLFKYDPSFKFDISSMADNYLLQQLAALLGNYRIENYKITVNNAMRVKGKNFKGDSWEEE
ncbi:MAG: hypothetical protein H7Y00_10965 [Fimbriimonadaceae bacterium]|nr:hypothetical protein [Chitinophagales bacterium]